jgi:importin subunit beta-1
VLQAIKSPVHIVSHTSAQVLAAFGAVDVPRNEWPALLPSLFHNISSLEVHEGCKVASLEALGYMCDTMDPDQVDASIVNQILSSIVDGMRADRRADIRLAAVKALNNSLDFTGKNFEVAVERDAIMQAICEATQAPDLKTREHAFECCATVAALYYDKLQSYVEALYQLSTNAIRTDDSSVGMQAIEFWNTVCDQEIDIVAELEEGETPSKNFLRITEQASPVLVALVLECMTKQEEDADDDAWNISMAAATLLEAIALTITDKIVDMVLPFVTQNINNANWRLKESALMAFGMILEGPTAGKLAPLVMQAMPILINCLKDPKTLVRDTSAWVIGKICELHQSCITGDILPAMVTGLSDALDDKEDKVVSQACYALHNIASACADESEAPSNVLSHFMAPMLQKLMTITNRGAWENDNLRTAAYEAVNMMVENCAMDMHSLVLTLLAETLNRLELTFSPQFNLTDRMNVQSSLCSLIGQIVRKLELNSFVNATDRILQLLLQVFTSKGAIAHEDALLAIGFVAEKMQDSFIRYVPFVQAPLVAGLKNVEEYQVCAAAVGVLGDICRSVGKGVLQYCDDIMRCLLELLQSPVLNRTVKPHVISVFADIAMAIEGEFERYASIVLGILKQAGEVNINSNDEDLIEYINTLRNSILEAYTGIIQGLKEGHKQELLLPALETIVDFIQRSACDQNRSDEVLKSSVGLLGDLGQSFGAKMLPVFQMPFVNTIINQALTEGIGAEEVANWTKSVSYLDLCHPSHCLY